MQFSPSIYEHAASLIHKSPWETSRDGDLLFHAHKTAFELYRHSPVIVGIDIYNLEPEAYGAVVQQPRLNGIPAITNPICSSARDIAELPIFDPYCAGRIPMVLEVGARLAEILPEADVRIPVSGPFSIASNLVQFETLLLEIITMPDKVLEALYHLIEGQVNFCKAILQHGLDIAFFESAATPPIISPQIFHEIELPPLKTLLQQAEAILGHPVPCIIGGNTAPILDAILETGTAYVICPSETDQERFMAHMEDYPDVMVRINMNPAILSEGNFDAVVREADRVIALAKKRERACIGTGVLPYETNPDVVLKVKDYIAQK